MHPFKPYSGIHTDKCPFRQTQDNIHTIKGFLWPLKSTPPSRPHCKHTPVCVLSLQVDYSRTSYMGMYSVPTCVRQLLLSTAGFWDCSRLLHQQPVALCVSDAPLHGHTTCWPTLLLNLSFLRLIHWQITSNMVVFRLSFCYFYFISSQRLQF